MRDKIIGLFTTKLHNDDSMLYFEKFHEYAHENNYAVITFYTEIDWYEKSNAEAARSFYMLNYNMVDAIVIDGMNIENKLVVDGICENAKNFNIPVYLINSYNKNCASFVFDVENAFEEMLTHLVKDHYCNNVGFIIGAIDKSESDKLISVYKKVLKQNNILFDSTKILYGNYSMEEIRKKIPDVLIDELDAIVCGNDEIAIEVAEYIADFCSNRKISIAGIGGSLRAKYFSPTITTIDKNPDAMLKRLFSRLNEDFSSVFRIREEHVLARVEFNESCGCEGKCQLDFRKKISDFYAEYTAEQEITAKLANFGNDIVKATSISDLSKILTDKIPEESCICVRDDFMQNVFRTEKVEEYPVANEKFYIIADNRKNNNLWATFPLKEVCTGMKNMLENDDPVIIVPIKYIKFYFGYIVINAHNYHRICYIIEHFGTVLNSFIGRNLSEKRFKYVSNELFHANESVKRMQYRDIMTGMYNYQGLLLGMDSMISESLKTNNNITIICIDLERLENINDMYGHSEGDNAIQTFAKILAECVDEESLCAHIGSDEFVIVVLTPENKEIQITENFFKAVDLRLDEYNGISGKNYSLETNQVYLTVKPKEGLDIKHLIDEAMNKKQIIKLNRRGLKDDENSNVKTKEEALTITELIDKNRFKYAYQPIVNARSGEIYAYEALMRPDSDDYISPLSILKFATDENRLYDIEKATFFNVLNQISTCREELLDKKIFLNSIPGYQLDSMDYAKVKRKFSDIFESLVVEITEQNEMSDDNLNMMRKRSDKEGFEVAIDDFGSGYSNTSSLLRYLPNYVKIDKLLITNINSEPKKQHFVKNIIEFAHSNGFLALAEGVETIDELKAVIHLDVDLIQGYYTAKPTFGFLKSLPEDIKHDILEANISGLSSIKKKLYVVGHENKILLMKLALSQYTGIVIANQEVTIFGNPDFSAGLSIKVLDNSNARVVFHNVKLSSEDDMACIEVGKNSHLTLVCEDNNELLQSGIHVPEGSSVTLEGGGNINVFVNGTQCYGIGAAWNESCGDIYLNMDGVLKVKSDGNKCIGIGGGCFGGNRGIIVTKGKLDVDVQGSAGVGIGFVSGNGPISISECNTDMDMRVASGVAVGCLEAEPDVYMNNIRLSIAASGNRMCGIGTLARVGGDIQIDSGRVIVGISGRCAYLIGNASGGMNISLESVRMDLSGEGNECLGIGTMEADGVIHANGVTLNINIRSGKNVVIGATKDNIFFEDVIENYVVS